MKDQAIHSTREEVLASAGPCDHAAHLYVDDASLVEAVGIFAGAALDRGEAVVLIATADHVQAMTALLENAGGDCDALRADGRLVCIDADFALAQIMRGDQPDRAGFESTVRPVVEALKRRHGQLAAYGELVNILWQQGNRPAADTLEQWWNELIAEHGFSLLCGYKVDPFDFQESTQRGIEAICDTHTHLVPVAEYDRLERAVDAAMRQVFHNGDARALQRHLLSRGRLRIDMPPAQAMLLALRDILPSLAQEVRLLARDHYRRDRGRKAEVGTQASEVIGQRSDALAMSVDL